MKKCATEEQIIIGKCGEYVSQLIYCHCQKNDIIKKLSINLKNGKSIVVQRVPDFILNMLQKKELKTIKKPVLKETKLNEGVFSGIK